MTVYKLTADPKCDVWDREGDHWTFVEELGMYRCEGQRVSNAYWYELLGSFGPLTDIKIPEVGETLSVAGGDSIPVEEVPEDAVFISGNVVCVRVENVFNVSGSNNVRRYLYPGTWTRLR